MAQKEIHISSDNPVPNAVDIYSSYTYNITFSMMPMSFWHSGKLPLGNSNEKIIIAQTGVTSKFNIDNLTINTVNDNYGSTSTSALAYKTKATFEITEPLGSSLVSLLTRGYQQLKKIDKENGNSAADLYEDSAGPLDLLYLLEVELIGYRGAAKLDGDGGMTMFDPETDVSGDPSTGEVFGKYAWPSYLTQFDFKPDHEGTKYNFETVAVDQYVKTLSDNNTRIIKQELNLEGENITEILNKLAADMTLNIVNSQTSLSPDRIDPERCHKIKIKLGQLSDGTTNQGTEWHADANVIPAKYLEEVPNIIESSDAVDEDGTGTQPDTIFVLKQQIKEGTKLIDAIKLILGKSATIPELFSDIKIDKNNPNKKTGEKNPTEPTYSWNIHSTLLASGKTTYTGGPQYTITYNIDLKQQAAVVTKESEEADEETQKDIIDNWYIVKKYDYMFSGLNDQIQDIDISFPQAQIFLFPEYGGLGPTYLDNTAVAQNNRTVEEQQALNDQRIKLTSDANKLLAEFRRIQTDLQSALSQIKKDGQDFVEGLSAQASPGALKQLNGRLPSSPGAVFAKIKVIESTTQFFDKTFNDLVNLQESIEDSANDFAGGLNLAGKVADIVKKAASPFDFVTTKISDGLSSVSTGIEGFVGTINESTGLSLTPDDIPGLGEAQQAVDSLNSLIDSVDDGGFSGGTIGNEPWGTNLTTGTTEDNPNRYLEELDFSNAENFIQPGKIRQVKAQSKKTENKEDGTTLAQHYFSTVLTYSGTGVAYLNRLSMTIKGDPYWIGSKNYASEAASGDVISILKSDGTQMRWEPQFNTDRSDTTSAPYDAGSVFFAFRYLFPKEYEHYQDDPALHTGTIDFKEMDMAYSGYYMVVKTTHSFVQGKFIQDIEAVKTTTYPNTVVFADGTTVNTDPSQGAGGGDGAGANGGEVDEDGDLVTRDLEGTAIALSNRINVEVDVTPGEATVGLSPEDQVDADRQAFLDGLSNRPVFDPNNPHQHINYLDPDFDYTQAYLLNDNGGG